jgi:hypothetical protein
MMFMTNGHPNLPKNVKHVKTRQIWNLHKICSQESMSVMGPSMPAAGRICRV